MNNIDRDNIIFKQNCMNHKNYPLNGHYLTSNVIYKAIVRGRENDNDERIFIGASELPRKRF